MFGFSLTKIVFTALVVFAVWKAFSYFTRMQDQRDRNARMKGRNAKSEGPTANAPHHDKHDGIEDMVECKVCGAYVARGAKSCGQETCPFQG